MTEPLTKFESTEDPDVDDDNWSPEIHSHEIEDDSGYKKKLG